GVSLRRVGSRFAVAIALRGGRRGSARRDRDGRSRGANTDRRRGRRPGRGDSLARAIGSRCGDNPRERAEVGAAEVGGRVPRRGGAMVAGKRQRPAAILRGELGPLAAACLKLEVLTYPKPGLVSHVDNGAHHDMDAALLVRSADALAPFFSELARAGAGGT